MRGEEPVLCCYSKLVLVVLSTGVPIGTEF